MSENNSLESNNEDICASQPTPEIFSDATSRLLNNIESPQKVYSASQPPEGILKKSRKSLGNGRRVSFAAMAHVRLFGSAEKEAAEEARRKAEAEAAEEAEAAAAEEEEEQRQLEEFRKQFSPENYQIEELKNSLNGFEIKSSPARGIVTEEIVTPMKRPFIAVDQSFDGKSSSSRS